jgi:hypothetical protein
VSGTNDLLNRTRCGKGSESEHMPFVDLSIQDRKARNGEPDSHVEFPVPDYSADLPLPPAGK